MSVTVQGSSGHGPNRLASIADLGVRYGETLRQAFTATELALLDEMRRTKDPDLLLLAAGSEGRLETVEEKLTRIANIAMARVPELRALKPPKGRNTARHLVLDATIAILETRTITQADGSLLVAHSSEHFPIGYMDRRKRP